MTSKFRMSDATENSPNVIAKYLRIEREEDELYVDEETGKEYETLFIEAIADVFVRTGNNTRVHQRIHSGGIGSVIVDNNDEDETIHTYEKEEMDNLKDILKTMGIPIEEEGVKA